MGLAEFRYGCMDDSITNCIDTLLNTSTLMHTFTLLDLSWECPLLRIRLAVRVSIVSNYQISMSQLDSWRSLRYFQTVVRLLSIQSLIRLHRGSVALPSMRSFSLALRS